MIIYRFFKWMRDRGVLGYVLNLLNCLLSAKPCC
jgi:hypothetical protein